MRQVFKRAASPYLFENSKQSKAVRGFYIVMVLVAGGYAIAASMGLLPHA